jgi:hypothetical protein
MKTQHVKDEQESKGVQERYVQKERYKLCTGCSCFYEYQANLIYCMACGRKLLLQCPTCEEPIIYPTLAHCPVCGESLANERSSVA